MSDIFEEPDDAATPLTEEEKRDLIPTHITFRRELNSAEQENIAKGEDWAARRKTKDVVDEKFITVLHRRMFGDVWKWAGKYRKSERNIGIEAWKIPMEMRNLLEDVRVWIQKQVYSPDEIALRFHHRLTVIHPFPNGNGRSARLLADLLVEQLGGKRFTWGKGSLRDAGDLRKRYRASLRAADGHDIAPLLEFARS